MKISEKNLLQKSLQNISGEQKQNFTNLPRNKNDISPKSSSFLSSRLSYIPEKIDSTSLQTILQTWKDSGIPLNEDWISKLFSFIQQNNTGNQELPQITRACLILLQNKIPLVPFIVESLASVFKSNESLTSSLFSDKNVPENNFKNLFLNFLQPPEELAKKINLFPQETLSVLKNLYKEDNLDNPAFKQLFGRHLLNLQERENILLSLEIPLIIPDYEEPVPFYFCIQRQNEEQDKSKTQKKKTYRINFIITLNKTGTIQADITCKQKTIKCKFFAELSRTEKLLKKFFPILKKRLNDQGFKVDPPLIESLLPGTNAHPWNLLKTKKIIKTDDKFFFIDIRV